MKVETMVVASTDTSQMLGMFLNLGRRGGDSITPDQALTLADELTTIAHQVVQANEHSRRKRGDLA